MTRPKPTAPEAPLLFAIFLDMVGFGMIIPDIQTRLESLGADGWLIGLVLSSYFLMQIIASPQWGRLSDRIGRKPVLLICGTLSCLSMLLYGIAHSVSFILLSRFCAGIAAANVVAAQAYLVDASANGANPAEIEQRRVAVMGRIGAAVTAGLVIGPALGGWLADLGGNLLLGLVAATSSGFGAIWIALAVPHVPPTPRNDTTETRNPFSLLRDVPALRWLFLISFIALFALACLEGTFGRLIHQRLGFGPREFGLIFGYEALLGVTVQVALLAWLSARLSSRLILVGAFALQTVGLALTPFAPSLIALFGLGTLYGTGAGIATPTLNSLSSRATPQERQGEMLGLLQGTRSAGFLIGPTLGGILFDWRPEAPYFLAGFALAVAAVCVRIVIQNGSDRT